MAYAVQGRGVRPESGPGSRGHKCRDAGPSHSTHSLGNLETSGQLRTCFGTVGEKASLGETSEGHSMHTKWGWHSNQRPVGVRLTTPHFPFT